MESGSEKKMSSEKRSVSLVLILIIVSVVIMIFLATQSLSAAYMYYQQGRIDQVGYNLMYGIIGVALSLYTVAQFRRRGHSRPIKEPDVMTIAECQKCDFKNVRKFAKGDYVMKTTEECPKCKEPMTITSIYQIEDKTKKPEEL